MPVVRRPSRGRASSVVTAVLVAALSACGGDGGGGASCEAFGACGGDPVGSWTVEEACPQPVDTLPGTCAGGELDPSELITSGTYVFAADGTMTLDLTQSGTLISRCPLDGIAACGGSPSGPMCEEVDGVCECRVAASGEPSMGASAWERSGGHLEMLGLSIPYCVEGDTMVLENYYGRLRLVRTPG